MYMSNGYGATGGAKMAYQNVDIEARVLAATPHQLIGILFEELTKALEIMVAAQRVGNRAKIIDKQARASNILLALETSLDFRNGGEIALNLARVYREARRLVQLGGRSHDPDAVERAALLLKDIIEAWEQIG
ncbi:MAG: flagellar protein FliS [Rhizorhabdus sp.]|jgi:flagellar protein FliS|nr:flagellar protein FliS [Rhizorhabdus sp.]